MTPENDSSSEKVPPEVMDRLRKKFTKLMDDYSQDADEPLVKGEVKIIYDGPAADYVDFDPNASIFGPVDSNALRDYVRELSKTSEIVEEQLP